MRKLPPLNSLRAFEAAARFKSFVLAGEELGVSSAAVSLQVKNLEENLGKKLFLRQGNRILLTDAGNGLYPKIGNALDEISEAAQTLRRVRHSRQLVISVVESFAELWLMPRLAQFAPDKSVTLDIRVQNDPIDFAKDAVDLRLTYESAYYPGYQQHELFTDVVIPVCSPRFWDAYNDPDGELTNVPHDKLIHVNWGPAYSSSPGWTAWFKRAGTLQPELGAPNLIISHLSLAVDAARAGLGVVLAPHRLVEQDINARRLIAASRITVEMGRPYVCIFPDARASYTALRLFLDHLGLTNISATG
jgi:LysR family glycine cleavage system transcriptional activator